MHVRKTGGGRNTYRLCGMKKKSVPDSRYVMPTERCILNNDIQHMFLSLCHVKSYEKTFIESFI